MAFLRWVFLVLVSMFLHADAFLFLRKRTADLQQRLSDSNFNGTRSKTVFFIHGFFENGRVNWIKDIGKEVLKNGDYNFISVDWKNGAGLPYTGATSNTRVVAAETSELIRHCMEHHHLKAADVYLVGHSLGAHTAGYIGTRIRGIGRITGLDPAKPWFEGTDPLVRLDPTDALFVDAVHTDSSAILGVVIGQGGIGMAGTVGHLDFYPNGGEHQPDCDMNPITAIQENGVEHGFKLIFGCDHIRSRIYFHYSINAASNGLNFKGHECNSYDSFINGACFECQARHCAEMGWNADKSIPTDSRVERKLYLTTGGAIPYTAQQYSVAIHLNNPDGARKENGLLSARVVGFFKSTGMTDLYGHEVAIKPDTVHTRLVTAVEELGAIQDVRFFWEHKGSVVLPGSWGWTRTPKIPVEKIVVTERQGTVTTMCALDELVENKKVTRFAPEYCD